MTTPVKVAVGLGERAYDILIGPGLLANAGVEIAARLPGSRSAIVTDENVAASHLEALRAGLERGGRAGGRDGRRGGRDGRRTGRSGRGGDDGEGDRRGYVHRKRRPMRICSDGREVTWR